MATWVKNAVKPDHYDCPKYLKGALKNVVHYYNHLRYQESLDNVTPATQVLRKREQIRRGRERLKSKGPNKEGGVIP